MPERLVRHGGRNRDRLRLADAPDQVGTATESRDGLLRCVIERVEAADEFAVVEDYELAVVLLLKLLSSGFEGSDIPSQLVVLFSLFSHGY
jgi:hypothetical protein